MEPNITGVFDMFTPGNPANGEFMEVLISRNTPKSNTSNAVGYVIL
jgi:hypothetical protein